MPNDKEQPDNLAPLMEEINWKSSVPDQAERERLIAVFKEKWLKHYTTDPETAMRIVQGMLSTFKAFEEEDTTPAMKVGEMEAARQLANWGFYDPPIYEEEIKAYAERFDLTEREAEQYLRRRRAYDS